MTWLDIILIFVLLFGGLLGLRSGLLWQVARVVILLGAVYACIHHHKIAEEWLDDNFTRMGNGTIWLLGYVLTFLVVCLAGFLVTWVLEYFLHAVQLKPIDRLLGGVVGVLKTALLSGALLTGVYLYGKEDVKKSLDELHVAPLLLKGIEFVVAAVPDDIAKDLSDGIKGIRNQGAEKFPNEEKKKDEEKKPAEEPRPDPRQPVKRPSPSPARQ